jgi:hypothetical protein
MSKCSSLHRRRHRPLLTAGLLGSLAFLITCVPEPVLTPLESVEGDVLTSHQVMMDFLGKLQAETEAFTMDTIGESGQGRPLVALRFGQGSGGGEKLKVLIYAQQHGNEPSGKEAAIALARDISNGAFDEFLETVDFYLVPQVNPDGSEMEQRRNAAGFDLNRDHLTLSTPEVAALHALYNRIRPDVTLDVHEYGLAGSSWVDAGLYKDFGQQIGGMSNANMSMALRQYAWDRVIPSMREALAPKEVYLRRYLVTDGPEARFRYSTAALNDGRNSMGIYHSLSFLIEGRNGLSVESDIRERARQQLETIKAFLAFFGSNAPEVKELVARERAALTGDYLQNDVALVMDYVPDPARPTVTVGVIDIESGEKSDLIIEAFHPSVEATLRVSRPAGYLIPADLTSVVEVLTRHGIPFQPTDGESSATVETYRIEAVTPSRKEDKDFLAVEVTATREETTIQEGGIIVWCDQLATNLIVTLLEPQSQWGLAPLPEFADMLTVGEEYPIKRILVED